MTRVAESKRGPGSQREGGSWERRARRMGWESLQSGGRQVGFGKEVGPPVPSMD